MDAPIATAAAPLQPGGTFNGTVVMLGTSAKIGLTRTNNGSFGVQFGTNATLFLGPGVVVEPKLGNRQPGQL